MFEAEDFFLCVSCFDNSIRAQDDAVARLELDFDGLVVAIGPHAQGVGIDDEFGDGAGGGVEVVGVGAAAIGQVQGVRSEVEFAEAEADEGTAVEGRVHGVVEAAEEGLDRVVFLHLAVEHAGEIMICSSSRSRCARARLSNID